jgi:hypothetical protein
LVEFLRTFDGDELTVSEVSKRTGVDLSVNRKRHTEQNARVKAAIMRRPLFMPGSISP